MADISLPDAHELEERKQKRFTKRVALITGIYAVALAIASLGGNNAMKEMLVASTEAANQWSFFQAKKLREHLYIIESERIQADLTVRAAALTPDSRKALTELRASHLKMAQKYKDDHAKISKAAKKFEKDRDSNATKDPFFDYAGVLLQISIILASISMLAESRAVFWFSLVAALGGTTLTVFGYAAG